MEALKLEKMTKELLTIEIQDSFSVIVKELEKLTK